MLLCPCRYVAIVNQPCWLSIISYPLRTRGMIVNYTVCNKTPAGLAIIIKLAIIILYPTRIIGIINVLLKTIEKYCLILQISLCKNNQKTIFKWSQQYFSGMVYCAVTENIHTPPAKGFLFYNPSPRKFHFSFIVCF